MARVAIYARKSSESDDKQAKSIEEQLAWARLKCAELGTPEPVVFQEARSARRPGRVEFGRLMAAVWRGEIETIVTWKADRLARNPSDSGSVQQALMEGKLVVVTSDRRYSEADDQFMLNIEFGFSTKYSQDLSKNVIRGLQSKWERGEWAGLAPIGYLNVTGERERRLRGGAIVVDPETAPRVRQLFQLCESGGHSLRDLTSMAVNDWFLQFRRSNDSRPTARYPMASIERILRNPFYYGALRIKGRLLPGSHEPLISKATFDRVQRILAGRRVGAERPSKHSFPFSTLIVCSLCGHRFTAYSKVKPSGRVYTYYRCSMGSKGCAQAHVTEREIIEVITPVLKQITLTPAERDRCIEVIHEINHDETTATISDLDGLRREQAAIVRKRSRILDLYVAGHLTHDEKQGLIADNDEKGTALELKIREAAREQAGWIELAERFFESLSDAEIVFNASNAVEKRSLLRTLRIELCATPEKLLLDAGKIATIVMNRGERPVWRALVEEVRTALISGSQ